MHLDKRVVFFFFFFLCGERNGSWSRLRTRLGREGNDSYTAKRREFYFLSTWSLGIRQDSITTRTTPWIQGVRPVQSATLAMHGREQL